MGKRWIPGLPAAALLALAACTSKPTEINLAPRRTFTDAEKAICPEHPFKPEFQDIKKVATPAGAPREFEFEIFDYEGLQIHLFKLTITGDTTGATPLLKDVWNYRDGQGVEVESGYYFGAVMAKGWAAEQLQCVFYVNPKDTAKLK